MVLHENFQKLAQEEIDQVVGNDRLPSLEDWPDLPTVNAIILETLR